MLQAIDLSVYVIMHPLYICMTDLELGCWINPLFITFIEQTGPPGTAFACLTPPLAPLTRAAPILWLWHQLLSSAESFQLAS